MQKKERKKLDRTRVLLVAAADLIPIASKRQSSDEDVEQSQSEEMCEELEMLEQARPARFSNQNQQTENDLIHTYRRNQRTDTHRRVIAADKEISRRLVSSSVTWSCASGSACLPPIAASRSCECPLSSLTVDDGAWVEHARDELIQTDGDREATADSTRDAQELGHTEEKQAKKKQGRQTRARTTES
jgi:hypothetical protein